MAFHEQARGSRSKTRTRIRMSFLVPTFVLCVFVGRNQMGLPHELSSEIPPYPGAEIASTMKLKVPAGAHASLRMNATPAKILRFYKEALKSNGWSIRVERESFLALFKDDLGLMIDVEESSLNSSLVTMVIVQT